MYYLHFFAKSIVCEKGIIYEDFEHLGIRGMLRNRGWESYMKSVGVRVEYNVKEFYNNAEPTEARQFTTFVRGFEFVVNPNVIFDMIKPMPKSTQCNVPPNPPIDTMQWAGF
ncbi:unnamed protein product [Ilex paraguariensis]|uniref:Uncharacterized protein n=1 Tax=Ilex paraguariensis TaxID=185542 RepID=A0ABC8QTK1_9AQUA